MSFRARPNKQPSRTNGNKQDKENADGENMFQIHRDAQKLVKKLLV